MSSALQAELLGTGTFQHTPVMKQSCSGEPSILFNEKKPCFKLLKGYYKLWRDETQDISLFVFNNTWDRFFSCGETSMNTFFLFKSFVTGIDYSLKI